MTKEGAESFASLARTNLVRLGLERAVVRVGRFEDALPDVLRGLAEIDSLMVIVRNTQH